MVYLSQTWEIIFLQRQIKLVKMCNMKNANRKNVQLESSEQTYHHMSRVSVRQVLNSVII